MIGLAVGIDYALFIVTRHRQNLAEGFGVEESAARANATAGGAVVFAGITVVIALAGLVGRRHPVPHGDGPRRLRHGRCWRSLIAVTLHPRHARLRRPQHRPVAGRPGPHRLGTPSRGRTLSARWARQVTERPGVALVGGLAFMLLLAVPMLSTAPGMHRRRHQPALDDPTPGLRPARRRLRPRLQRPAAGSLSTSRTARIAPRAALSSATAALAADPGVLVVGEAVVNEPPDTAIIPVVPRSSPSSAETEDLVHHLRDDVVPALEAQTGADGSRRRGDRGAHRRLRQDGRRAAGVHAARRSA